MAKLLLSMQPTEWCSQIRALLSVNNLSANNKNWYGYLYVLLFIFLLLPEQAYAQSADFGRILSNFSRVIVPLTAMVLVISFSAGIFLIFRSLTYMKKFGQGHTMSSAPGEFTGPLTQMVIGSILVFLPTSTNFMMNSLFQTADAMFDWSGNINYQALGQGASLLGYSSGAALDQYWAQLADTLILFIQFLGFLSFVRGWFMLAKIGTPGTQQGQASKGITHVIGGICLINIVGLLNIIQTTLMS